MKCDLCGKEMEALFLDKFKGTVVKVNVEGKNKIYNICSECQIKHKDIKSELIKKY